MRWVWGIVVTVVLVGCQDEFVTDKCDTPMGCRSVIGSCQLNPRCIQAFQPKWSPCEAGVQRVTRCKQTCYGHYVRDPGKRYQYDQDTTDPTTECAKELQ